MFDELFQYYLNQYSRKGESVLRSIIELSVPSTVVLMYYKKCEPLESLPEEKKKELYLFAREMYPNETSKVILKTVCKIIYTVGTFL